MAEFQSEGLQALMREGLPAGMFDFPLRNDTAPRAVFPAGQLHLEAIATGARALEKATLWPFMVMLRYRLNGAVVNVCRVVESPASESPLGDDLLPAGAELLRSDVMPAARFGDMGEPARYRYEAEYRVFLLWRLAKALGKPVDQLQPGVDIDATLMDKRVSRWLRGEGSVAA